MILDWAAVSKIPVIVMYMAIKHLPVIIEEAYIQREEKKDEPIAIIQDATL